MIMAGDTQIRVICAPPLYLQAEHRRCTFSAGNSRRHDAVTHPVTLCDGMLPGLGPSPGKILTAAYRPARLMGHALSLLARRYTEGSLGQRDRAAVAVMDVTL
jgi:hypothetical protein